MYTTSAVKTAFSTVIGMKTKKMDARITIDQSIKSALSATGVVTGKENADERKRNRG